MQAAQLKLPLYIMYYFQNEHVASFAIALGFASGGAKARGLSQAGASNITALAYPS